MMNFIYDEPLYDDGYDLDRDYTTTAVIPRAQCVDAVDALNNIIEQLCNTKNDIDRELIVGSLAYLCDHLGTTCDHLEDGAESLCVVHWRDSIRMADARIAEQQRLGHERQKSWLELASTLSRAQGV